MQKPHWRPKCSWKACWSGWSSAPFASDSTVSICAAVRLDGEGQARPRRAAVEQHRARAADAVLAADVRAVEAAARGG